MKKAKIVKTELGWEPAFYWEAEDIWVIEPGFVRSTREAAKALLEDSLNESAACDGADRVYAAGYAAACGY